MVDEPNWKVKLWWSDRFAETTSSSVLCLSYVKLLTWIPVQVFLISFVCFLCSCVFITITYPHPIPDTSSWKYTQSSHNISKPGNRQYLHQYHLHSSKRPYICHYSPSSAVHLHQYNKPVCLILTCLCPESDYTLQKTRPYYHDSGRLGPIPGAGGLTLLCAHTSCHHHTSTRTCFLTSHWSRSILPVPWSIQHSLLWFGGRLEQISPAVFARPGDATACEQQRWVEYPKTIPK